MACYYGAVHLIARAEPRRFLYPTGFAPLGYAIPAAIGAKLAHPDRGVVALVGDGGAMFTLPELAAAAELGLGIVVVVVNDGGYGEIRREMVERGQPPIAVDIPSPDFAGAATAFGARGVTTAEPGELTGLLEEALAIPQPSLIDVRVA
jgi:acetolactate synthase-1/2/3 large subunit